MPMNFKLILEKFLTDELTPEELSFFLVAVREPANEPVLLAAVGDKLRAYQGLSIKEKMPEMFQAMLNKAALLDKEALPDTGKTTHWPPVAPTRRLFPFRQ